MATMAMTKDAIQRKRKENKHFLGELISKYKDKCAYCCKTSKHYHIDHIIPVQKGGKDVFNNYALACIPCNDNKCCRTLMEWFYHDAFEKIPFILKPYCIEHSINENTINPLVWESLREMVQQEVLT